MAEKWSDRLLRTRAQVQTLIAGSGLNYPGFFQISNAVGATKQILVWSKSASTINQMALNLTDDTIGIYDITADTFTESVLLAANNLSDVADAATSNNNLGNTHLTYTPTCVTTLGTGTLTPLGDCFVIVIDADSVSFTFYFQIDLGGGENDGSYTFTLPTGHLPTNNFAAAEELQFVVGLPNAGLWDATKLVAYSATIGAKTGGLSFHSDSAGDTIKLTAFIRYHK